MDITDAVQSRIVWREGNVIDWNGAKLPTQEVQVSRDLADDLVIGSLVEIWVGEDRKATLILTDVVDDGNVTKIRLGTLLADSMDRLGMVSLTGAAPADAVAQLLGTSGNSAKLAGIAAKQTAALELCNAYALAVDNVKTLDILARLANLGSAELMVGADGLVWWSDGEVVETSQGIDIASRLQQDPQARTGRLTGYSVDYFLSGDVPATGGTPPVWSGDFGVRSAVQAATARAAQAFGQRRIARAARKRYKATVTTRQPLFVDEWYLYDGRLLRLSALTHHGGGFAEAEFEGADE